MCSTRLPQSYCGAGAETKLSKGLVKKHWWVQVMLRISSNNFRLQSLQRMTILAAPLHISKWILRKWDLMTLMFQWKNDTSVTLEQRD